jgi:hypothetical protein
MLAQLLCIIPFLFSYTYKKDITLGAPDTVKILIDPVKVVEINDTIIVLDQEDNIQFIKRYTLDGFFIDARLYSQKPDSILFSQLWSTPTEGIIKKADFLVSKRTGVCVENQKWRAMFIEPDSMIWLVCGWFIGDGGGLATFAAMPDDTVWRVSGYGPLADDYSIRTIRGTKHRFYLYVSPRYVYIIASEFLWQYDKQARFVRKIGIEPNQCFKEPCSIAIDNHSHLYIADFRLGIIWEYRSGGKTLNLKQISVSEDINPETPTSLAFSKLAGLWVNNIHMKIVSNIICYENNRTFGINKITCRPGGTNFQIAVTNKHLLVYYSNHVFKYSSYGEFIETYQPTDYELKKDNIISMDNTGNFYMMNRGKNWADVTFYCINPITHDTSALVLPDSFQANRLNCEKVYRTGDTLYMYSATYIYHSKGESSSFRGFLVFVNDTLKYTISESEFEGGLPERIIDFVIDSYGLIWVVDIDKRIVQRYRLLPKKGS